MTQERERGAIPGIWSILLIVIGVPILAFALLGYGIKNVEATPVIGGAAVVASILVGITWFTLLGGFFIVEPNGSKVMVLFGKYQGTVKNDGFYWAIRSWSSGPCPCGHERSTARSSRSTMPRVTQLKSPR